MLFRLIPYNNLKRRLSYYVSAGKLKKPRRGIYTKKEYNQLELAAKLCAPSYISLETVLEQEGIIFQKYESIFSASYLSRNFVIDGQKLVYRKLKNSVLLNKKGIVNKDNYFIATKERAFLDAVFLYKNYHFDNLSALDWEKITEYAEIYENAAFKKRVNSYYRL